MNNLDWETFFENLNPLDEYVFTDKFEQYHPEDYIVETIDELSDEKIVTVLKISKRVKFIIITDPVTGNVSRFELID